MNKSKIITFILTFLFWCALTWKAEWQTALAGILVALFVAWIAGDLLTEHPQKFAQLRRYFWFFCFLPVLLWIMIKAGFLTLYRIFKPRPPENAGTAVIRTTLKSSSGLVFLANALTLGDEVVSLDVEKESGNLIVSCVDKASARENGPLAQNVRMLEKILTKVFEN